MSHSRDHPAPCVASAGAPVSLHDSSRLRTVEELIHDDEREQDFEAMAMLDEARAQFRHEVDLFELHPIRKPLQPTRGRQT